MCKYGIKSRIPMSFSAVARGNLELTSTVCGSLWTLRASIILGKHLGKYVAGPERSQHGKVHNSRILLMHGRVPRTRAHISLSYPLVAAERLPRLERFHDSAWCMQISSGGPIITLTVFLRFQGTEDNAVKHWNGQCQSSALLARPVTALTTVRHLGKYRGYAMNNLGSLKSSLPHLCCLLCV